MLFFPNTNGFSYLLILTFSILSLFMLYQSSTWWFLLHHMAGLFFFWCSSLWSCTLLSYSTECSVVLQRFAFDDLWTFLTESQMSLGRNKSLSCLFITSGFGFGFLGFGLNLVFHHLDCPIGIATDFQGILDLVLLFSSVCFLCDGIIVHIERNSFWRMYLIENETASIVNANLHMFREYIYMFVIDHLDKLYK